MGLADGAAWLATLSRIGPVALAVTSHLSIDFLAKPGQADLLAHAKLLRLGRRQSVSEVRLWSDGTSIDDPVAFATVTYAIPVLSSGARGLATRSRFADPAVTVAAAPPGGLRSGAPSRSRNRLSQSHALLRIE